LGYDEWIRVEISKEGCDMKTIRIALSLAFPGIVECIEECDQYTEGEDCLHFERDGRHLWDHLMLFEEFSVKEISEKLGCAVSVYYEGEDKDDAESVEVVNGEIKSHKVLGWVDVLEEIKVAHGHQGQRLCRRRGGGPVRGQVGPVQAVWRWSNF